MADRRNFLKVMSASVAGFGFSGITAAQSDPESRPPWAESQDRAPAPAEFHVKGTQTIRVVVTPDEIVRHVQKRSPALKRRYGLEPPVVKATNRRKRLDSNEDVLPKRKTYTKTQGWNTYYAMEDEWSTFYTDAAENNVSISSHDPSEEYNSYGIWEYNKLSGGYEIVAPMNVISTESLSNVMTVFESANNWTTLVVQEDRWAWNSDVNTFQKQHNSAATSTEGLFGRHHIRMWEFGGHVSGSAHEDSGFPHSAISYDDAEVKVDEAFDNEGGWWGYDNWYNLSNGGMLDHDGFATGMFTI